MYAIVKCTGKKNLCIAKILKKTRWIQDTEITPILAVQDQPWLWIPSFSGDFVKTLEPGPKMLQLPANYSFAIFHYAVFLFNLLPYFFIPS